MANAAVQARPVTQSDNLRATAELRRLLQDSAATAALQTPVLQRLTRDNVRWRKEDAERESELLRWRQWRRSQQQQVEGLVEQWRQLRRHESDAGSAASSAGSAPCDAEELLAPLRLLLGVNPTAAPQSLLPLPPLPSPPRDGAARMTLPPPPPPRLLKGHLPL
eukprot:Hpha_TRINITY_DN31022_c0_g1::TRINITY_DN31022_c0_g1_i1::g.63931::m.63931